MRIVSILALVILVAAPASSANLSKFKPWTGDATPPLELTDLNGTPHRLAAYRGKVVVVNFWATWCAPCIEEMPTFERLAQRMSSEAFALLTVNFGEDPERIEPFLKKTGIDLPVLLDQNMRASRDWVKRGLPTTFVIDAEQNIRYQVIGELAWDAPEVEAKLRDLLPK